MVSTEREEIVSILFGERLKEGLEDQRTYRHRGSPFININFICSAEASRQRLAALGNPRNVHVEPTSILFHAVGRFALGAVTMSLFVIVGSGVGSSVGSGGEARRGRHRRRCKGRLSRGHCTGERARQARRHQAGDEGRQLRRRERRRPGRRADGAQWALATAAPTAPGTARATAASSARATAATAPGTARATAAGWVASTAAPRARVGLSHETLNDAVGHRSSRYHPNRDLALPADGAGRRPGVEAVRVVRERQVRGHGCDHRGRDRGRVRLEEVQREGRARGRSGGADHAPGHVHVLAAESVVRRR